MRAAAAVSQIGDGDGGRDPSHGAPREADPANLLLVARALVWLGVIGLSVGLLLQHLHRPTYGWFAAWHQNLLFIPDRRRIIIPALAGAILAWTAAFAFLRRRGLAGAPALYRVARVLAPAALAGLLPGLLAVDVWDDPLQELLLIAAFVAAVEALARVALQAWHEGPSLVPPAALTWWQQQALPPVLAPLVVVAAALGYGAYMGHFTVLNHRAFNTGSYDLGIYDNQFWQALHGHPFRSTPVLREGNWSVLKSHAEFAMYALLPIYALRPRAETLLWLQSFVLGLGAIPIYRFAARRLSRAMACVLALAYLAYAPLHGANSYDFHFQPIAAVCVLWAIDLFDTRRWIAFALMFVLALLCREDISLMLFAFGAFMIASGEQPRAGALVAAIALAYFGLVKFVVMPHFGSWWFADMYKDLYPPDHQGYGGIIETLVGNPIYALRTLFIADKLRYVLLLFIPLAFLPLRFSRLWWLAFPGAFLTLLSTHYPATIMTSFQYTAYWFALMFPATVFALAWLRRGQDGLVRQRAAFAALVAGALVMTVHFGAIPPPARKFPAAFGTFRFAPLTQALIDKEKHLGELMAQIPKNAAVAVSDNELPHVSARAECYNLKDGFEGADYVVYAPTGLGADHAVDGQRKRRLKILDSRPGLVLLKVLPR